MDLPTSARDRAISHRLLTRKSIDQLLARTAATGSPVTCSLPDELDQLPGPTTAVVYRVVQEGLTNAIKHAPGAPIDVSVTSSSGNIRVVVRNGTPTRSIGRIAVPGSGRGIAGLTERVHAVKGTLTTGSVGRGGWQLCAELPRRSG